MIRKATRGDIPRMITLQREVEDDDALWGYGADSPDQWAQTDLAWTMVADFDGDLRGFILCRPRPYDDECVFAKGSKILEIAELIVTEDARDQGLGGQLVATMRKLAKKENFTHLRVYSASKRFDDLLKFYRRCGFNPWYLELTQEIGSEPDDGPGLCK